MDQLNSKPPILSRTKHCKTSGFTLIELLVVISIISLLVSILLPSLAAARKTSRRIQCLNKTRQTQLGIAMYASDFRDYFPTDTASAGAEPWIILVADYLNQNSTHSYTFRPLYQCPEKLTHITNASDWKFWFTDYGIHRALINNVRTSDIQKPSNLFLLGDYYDVTIRVHYPGNVNQTPQRIADTFCHQETMNIAYADGHGGNIRHNAELYPTITTTFVSYWGNPDNLPVFPVPFADN
ncbi:MAG TPA: hypothetical protein DCM28_15210 [Phycisphaerales bacterium]|nr:hypothetical protein [Phycisphaerales bacterium]HCD35307.1 hypothetical protein [Phycisphaerales bacterium]|tara:strand:- start:3047 stop:3763 length:717 start_codon:yes stop_codon:yes gene_type:complete